MVLGSYTARILDSGSYCLFTHTLGKAAVAVTQEKTCKTCVWWVWYVFPTDNYTGYCSCRDSSEWWKKTNGANPCDKHESTDKQREMRLK